MHTYSFVHVQTVYGTVDCQNYHHRWFFITIDSFNGYFNFKLMYNLLVEEATESKGVTLLC